LAAPALQREALRQQLLLRALWGDNTLPAIQGWLRESPVRALRGLNAYAATGGTGAERALAQAFPTVVAVMGEESFGQLARAYRLARPPRHGDLTRLGEHLPDFIENDPQLADVPYLADVARLDALLDHAGRAADVASQPGSLGLLQQLDPAEVVLELAPGAALMSSRWPVVTIHQAHAAREAAQGGGAADGPTADAPVSHGAADLADPFAPARAALARGEGQCAFVWRRGFKPAVALLAPAQIRFMQALLGQRSLGQALDQAGPGFVFESWLLQALQLGWFLVVRPVAASASAASHSPIDERQS
jgi:hypothetical protein